MAARLRVCPNYFSPMSLENKNLFKLVDEEVPDIALLLHTGCHRQGKLLQPYYVPGFTTNCVLEFVSNLKNDDGRVVALGVFVTILT